MTDTSDTVQPLPRFPELTDKRKLRAKARSFDSYAAAMHEEHPTQGETSPALCPTHVLSHTFTLASHISTHSHFSHRHPVLPHVHRHPST